jgi:hypothetical protein
MPARRLSAGEKHVLDAPINRLDLCGDIRQARRDPPLIVCLARRHGERDQDRVGTEVQGLEVAAFAAARDRAPSLMAV